jgi:hypothetical protein
MKELRKKALDYVVGNYEEWPQPSALGNHATVSHCGYSWEQKGPQTPWELINDANDIITETDFKIWESYIKNISCEKGASYSIDHILRYIKETNREMERLGNRIHGEGLLVLSCTEGPIQSFVLEICSNSGDATYVRAI